MSEIHPELRGMARFLPRAAIAPRLLPLFKFGQRRLIGVPKPPVVNGVAIRDIIIPGPKDNPSLRVRLYTPDRASGPYPAMLWIHGGGFVIGFPEQDEPHSIEMCRELGLVVAAVAYRLSPDHQYPAPMDDCYAALTWLHGQAGALGIAPGRIAIGGMSAGGGLAAGLVLLAHDRKEVPVAFQLLIYPMLDDRTARRADINESCLRLWNNKCNSFGWKSYLGREPGSDGVSDYAAPGRRANLTGLPPAWIGVGTCDLFHDEDRAYAGRLSEAGVSCVSTQVDGAFHGFDAICPKAKVTQEFRRNYKSVVRRALCAR